MDHSSGLVFRRPQATLTADLWSIFAPPFSIKEIRQKNIALATAPMLITQLPTDEAVVEIQKLLKSLYGEESR